MINIGNKIFPLFAPKVRAEPIIPISEIEEATNEYTYKKPWYQF